MPKYLTETWEFSIFKVFVIPYVVSLQAAIQEDDSKLLKIYDIIQQLPPPHYRSDTQYLEGTKPKGHREIFDCVGCRQLTLV